MVSMKILSIDSGIEKTGYAIFTKEKSNTGDPRLVTSGLIKTDKKLSVAKRLQFIFNEFETIIQKHKPDLVVIEQLFFFHNQKTAIQVSQSQGTVLLLCAQHNLEAEFLTPLQIKQIVTGYGQSDKKAIQKMLKLTLNLSIPPGKDDEADAIACGLAYCYLNRNLVK